MPCGWVPLVAKNKTVSTAKVGVVKRDFLNTPGARVPHLAVQEAMVSPSLFSTLEQIHLLVNHSQPEVGQYHWLLLGPQPLYYIGIGTSQIVSPLINKTHCNWAEGWGSQSQPSRTYKGLEPV